MTKLDEKKDDDDDEKNKNLTELEVDDDDDDNEGVRSSSDTDVVSPIMSSARSVYVRVVDNVDDSLIE